MTNNTDPVRALIVEMTEYLDQQVDPELDVIAKWRDRLEDALASALPSAPVGVEAYLVERLGGEGYGNTRSIIDAAFYDPTKPAFWSSPEAQARHRVTPLVPALAQQPAAAQPQPKRRPYNASGSLGEYGVFPECDAALAAQQQGGA